MLFILNKIKIRRFLYIFVVKIEITEVYDDQLRIYRESVKIIDKRRQIILDTVWRNWNQDKWNIIVFTVIHRYTGDIRRRHIVRCTTLGYRLQVEALSDLYPKVIAKITTLKHHPKGRCFFLFFISTWTWESFNLL